MAKRAIRRRHTRRLKKRALQRVFFNNCETWNSLTDYGNQKPVFTWCRQPESIWGAVGIYMGTPCRCSCVMCGNPRKYYGNKLGLTWQERDFALAQKEQLLDFWNPGDNDYELYSWGDYQGDELSDESG